MTVVKKSYIAGRIERPTILHTFQLASFFPPAEKLIHFCKMFITTSLQTKHSMGKVSIMVMVKQKRQRFIRSSCQQ